jgi:hypothetical protein
LVQKEKRSIDQKATQNFTRTVKKSYAVPADTVPSNPFDPFDPFDKLRDRWGEQGRWLSLSKPPSDACYRSPVAEPVEAFVYNP